jgi:DUF1009 family protein
MGPPGARRPEATEGVRTVGLLCGAGVLPLRVAVDLRRRGYRIVAVGIRGEADAALGDLVDECHWSGIAKLGRWLSIFTRAHADVLLMLGGIRKARMFGDKLAMLPDWKSVRFWYGRLRSRQDHTILGAVAGEFESAGIRVGTLVDYCPGLMAEPGRLGGPPPNGDQWEDIRFAWPICKQVAGLQIGQCIVVKDRAVIAVEGIDGTDAVLERGGRLAGGGAVAVKVARDGHDDRFDLPCIGPETVDTLECAGVVVLAVEAGQTIVLDRDDVRARAERSGVCVLAVGPDDLGEAGP